MKIKEPKKRNFPELMKRTIGKQASYFSSNSQKMINAYNTKSQYYSEKINELLMEQNKALSENYRMLERMYKAQVKATEDSREDLRRSRIFHVGGHRGTNCYNFD